MTGDWFSRGYQRGSEFASHEADYDELAAIYRAGKIPVNWDLYRAEILNRHMGDNKFDFKAYSDGFAQACIKFFKNI